MNAINYVLLLSGLVLVTFFDIKYRLIPNKILIALIICKVMLFLIMGGLTPTKMTEIITVVVISMIIYFVFKNKIGAGDIKLEIVISLYLSSVEFVCSLLVSAFFLLIYSIIMFFSKGFTYKKMVPLSPFVTLGVIISLVFL